MLELIPESKVLPRAEETRSMTWTELQFGVDLLDKKVKTEGRKSSDEEVEHSERAESAECEWFLSKVGCGNSRNSSPGDEDIQGTEAEW